MSKELQAACRARGMRALEYRDRTRGPLGRLTLGRALGHPRGLLGLVECFPAPPGLVRMPEGQAGFLGDSHTSLC